MPNVNNSLMPLNNSLIDKVNSLGMGIDNINNNMQHEEEVDLKDQNIDMLSKGTPDRQFSYLGLSGSNSQHSIDMVIQKDNN